MSAGENLLREIFQAPPVEKLQAAIEKLQALKAASTPGPLYAQNAGDVFTDLGAPNAQGVNAEHNDAWHVASFMSGQNEMPYREEEANRALYLTLHCTIYAQLEILRFAVKRLKAITTLTGLHLQAHEHEVALADAILGGDS